MSHRSHIYRTGLFEGWVEHLRLSDLGNLLGGLSHRFLRFGRVQGSFALLPLLLLLFLLLLIYLFELNVSRLQHAATLLLLLLLLLLRPR